MPSSARLLFALCALLIVASCSETGGSVDSGAGATGGTPAAGGGASGGDGGSPLSGGSGGSAATGGSMLTGGSSGSGSSGGGGTGATGGADPQTGGQPSGGSESGGGPQGGQGGGASGGSGPIDTTPIDCTITATGEPSTVIASVVAITLQSDLSDIIGGTIEFGPDESYGLTAPLDIQAESFRTLLLGMPFQTEVHFRVNLYSDVGTCTGEDATISTGQAPEGVPQMQATLTEPELVTPGFVIIGTGSWATIWNHQGQLVWAYQVEFNGVTRAALTYDGKYLVARDGNPSGNSGRGTIRKISMDGQSDDPIVLDRSHHDFSATPDNGLLFLVNSEDNCGKVVKMDSSGTFSDVFTVADAFDDVSGNGSDLCHMNSIHYHLFDDSITFSSLNQDAYVKISSGGELQWVLGGGADSDFSGDSVWDRQHGHMMTDEDHLIFFNNRSQGQSALLVEVELDQGSMTATNVLEYDGDGQSMTLGDVQKLPSGNYLVTYCNDGLQREITPEETTVREFSWGDGVGYATHRPTLYGPPPVR